MNTQSNDNNDKNLQSTFWEPTLLIRWATRPLPPSGMFREKVLQQMWQGNMGEQEWRDVETVSLD